MENQEQVSIIISKRTAEVLSIKYVPMKNPQDLYIITTAMKRDSHEWDSELANYRMSTDSEQNK